MSTLTNDLARLANSANVLVSAITTNGSAITSVSVGGITINSSGYTGDANNATYLGGSNLATIEGHISNAYSNATAYADTKAAAAYANSKAYTDASIAAGDNATAAYINAVSYTDTKIGTANTAMIANASAAYSNSVTYVDTKIGTANSAIVANAGAAYTNSVSYTDSAIGTANTAMVANASAAYTNAVSYTDTKIGTANSAITGNAATAYSNAVSYTDTKIGLVNTAISANASAAYTNATTYSSNASNISSGTVAEARLPYRMNQNVRTSDNVEFAQMTLTGNLVVSGNVNIIGANNLSVSDNMIYLNSNNDVTNPDIGIAGNYNDGSYAHTGIFRDATDGIWKVFDNYTPEPDANVYIDTSNTSFHLANFQANTYYAGNTSTNWMVANTSGITTTGYANVGTTLQVSGNVGIGSSASSKLTVTSGTNDGVKVTDGTVTTILYNTSSSSGSVGTVSNHGFGFYSNNAQRGAFSAAGDFVIGTATDGGNNLRYFDLQNANTGASAGAIMRFITANSSGGSLVTVDMAKYKNGSFYINNNDGSGFISIGTAGTSNRLYIGANGNIGVATNTPAYTLDISGTGRASSDFRAPVFYDSDNTGYYVDPASSSVFNTLLTYGYTTYSSSYGYRARYTNGADTYSSYFNWQGVQLGNNGSNYIVAGRDATGGALYIYTNATSAWPTLSGTASALFNSDGRFYSYVDTRSPIFYDSDNTSYYMDGAGTTSLNTVNIAGTMTMTGFLVGKTNNGGSIANSNDTGSMSIRGDGTNAAAISFHRPSAYAINMGLDTDNSFKIGGWSDGAAYRLQLSPPGGTHTLNGTLVTSSRGISQSSMPAGSVIQVVQAVLSAATTINTNTTAAAVTNWLATITPTSSTSKILILCEISYGTAGGVTTYGGYFKRNGTIIGIGDAGASQQRIGFGLDYTGDGNQVRSIIYSYLDSPASTSAQTYQMWVNNDNNNTLYLNRSASDQSNATGKRSISTITLLEIAQ